MFSISIEISIEIINIFEEINRVFVHLSKYIYYFY